MTNRGKSRVEAKIEILRVRRSNGSIRVFVTFALSEDYDIRSKTFTGHRLRNEAGQGPNRRLVPGSVQATNRRRLATHRYTQLQKRFVVSLRHPSPARNRCGTAERRKPFLRAPISRTRRKALLSVIRRAAGPVHLLRPIPSAGLAALAVRAEMARAIA